MTATAASLHLYEVTFRYPGAQHDVLRSLSLELTPGERVAVLGPNGSGKTTLALHLNGLLEPQQGWVEVGGTRVSPDHLREVRQRVGLVFQDPDDQLFMPSVRHDVAFGPANLGMRGEQRDRAVADALRAVDATDLGDRSPHHLSGGERRRVALATVLAMSPEVLVLDEPTSGLDPVGRRELAELLVTLDHTLVVVTHDLPFALATCERSVVVDDGRIVADRDTAALLAEPELLARHRLELPMGFELRQR